MFYCDTQIYINGAKTRKKRQERSTEIDDAQEQLASAGENEIKAIIAEKSRDQDTSKDWAWPGSKNVATGELQAVRICTV
jgi:hypothetical protein